MSMVCTVNSVTVRIPILGTTHLPAELNTNADLLSRLADSALSLSQTFSQSSDMRGARVIDLRMQNILPLCDSHLGVGTEEEFLRFWSDTRAALRQYSTLESPIETALCALYVTPPFLTTLLTPVPSTSVVTHRVQG
jgi:hypothetical protein